MERVKATIIGAGAVGTAIARELSEEYPGEIFVVEKNQSPRGENQSSRNSGVVHAGVYYNRDTEPQRAKFCVEGNRLMYEFCDRYKVPCKAVGKLIVATNEEEDKTLDEYLQRAVNNGVPGVRKITGDEAKKMEPNVNACSALHLPTSGIVDPVEFVDRLRGTAVGNGANFLYSTGVVDVAAKDDCFDIKVKTSDGQHYSFESSILVNAAGLFSDEVAKMINPENTFEINPLRGEAMKFYKTRRPTIGMAGMNVYPAPYFYTAADGTRRRTVGVHLTPTFDENGEIGKTVTVGPGIVTKVSREDYSSSLPLNFFHDRVVKFFPDLQSDDLELHQAGILAQLKGKSIQADFVIEPDKKYPNAIQLVGIDSPGLTSSLAIAKYVRTLIKELCIS